GKRALDVRQAPRRQVPTMTKARRPEAPVYEPGDVFAVSLPNGWFGAVRIVQRANDPNAGARYLIATTPYFAPERPFLNDPKLNEVLSPNYFSWVDMPALNWVDGAPPAPLTYLGRLERTDNAQPVRHTRDQGAWKDYRSDEAYTQWRWHNDRAAII